MQIAIIVYHYSGFQLSATEIRYLGAQLALKVRRALGRVSRLQLQTTAICYRCIDIAYFLCYDDTR
jgi:hypothetical protein